MSLDKKPKLYNIVDNSLKLLLFGLFWSMLFCVPIVMVKYCISYPDFFSVQDLPIFFLTIIIMLTFFRYIDYWQINKRGMIVMSFGFANLAMCISLLTFDTQPCSDYNEIFNVASDMANDCFNIYDHDVNSYIYIYNWQLGISVFESFLFRLFGCNMICLQILNLIIINISLWLTYKLAKSLTDEKAACLTLMLMSTYYPILVTVNQFTNQHAVLPLIISVLLCLKRRKWWMWMIAGIMTATLNFFRPMGILLVLTALLFTVCMIFKTKNDKKAISIRIACVLAFLSVFFIVEKAYDFAMITAEYADTPVSKPKIPYFKFNKGLTGHNTPDLQSFDYDLDRYNEWEKQQVVDAITKTPKETISYVATKMIRYLGEFDWKFENTYNHDIAINTSYPVKGFVIFGWAQYIIILVLAIIGYWKWKKKYAIDPVEIFYIGLTTVYFFIEAFSSYRYESYPILFIFAGMGLSRFFYKWHERPIKVKL